jgi:hypothetical protein
MSIPVEIVGRSQDLGDWIIVAAAVVQAIGSVLAILAAAWLTNHDRREALVLQRIEKRRAFGGVLAECHFTADLAARSLQTLEDARWAAEGYLGRNDYIRRLEMCADALGAVPLHEVDEFEAVEGFVQARCAVDDLLAILRPSDPGTMQDRSQRAGEARGHANHLEMILRNYSIDTANLAASRRWLADERRKARETADRL